VVPGPRFGPRLQRWGRPGRDPAGQQGRRPGHHLHRAAGRHPASAILGPHSKPARRRAPRGRPRRRLQRRDHLGHRPDAQRLVVHADRRGGRPASSAALWNRLRPPGSAHGQDCPATSNPMLLDTRRRDELRPDADARGNHKRSQGSTPSRPSRPSPAKKAAGNVGERGRPREGFLAAWASTRPATTSTTARASLPRTVSPHATS
jgi:hypothetical protein